MRVNCRFNGEGTLYTVCRLIFQVTHSELRSQQSICTVSAVFLLRDTVVVAIIRRAACHPSRHDKD